MKTVVPVIMSGGAGSRLWPVSRRAAPKQLLKLTGPRSMLQETLHRARNGDDMDFSAPVILANCEHLDEILTQIAELDLKLGQVVLEPEGRNTAAAAVCAALLAEQIQGPDALLLLMPADHHVRDVEAFRLAVADGVAAAEQGSIVTLGISPRRPETGYGYIRAGASIDQAAFKVECFREKPAESVAEQYLREGGWYWNAGLFLFRADVMIAEAERHAPATLDAVKAALSAGKQEGRVRLLDAKAFRCAPDVSLDVAIMEKTDRAAVVPVECGWDDVGSFASLWEIGQKDEHGVVAVGDGLIHAIDASNVYIRAEGIKIAAIGVEDLIIVGTRDAVLVLPRKDAQKVKHVVEALKAAGREDLL